MDQKQKTDPYHQLRETAERWLKMVSTTIEASTLANYKTVILQFIYFLNAYFPEIIRFSQLKRSPHIEEWLFALAKRNPRLKARRLRIIQIRRFLNDIYEWGWDKAPAEELFTQKDFPPVEKYLPRPITPEADKKLKETLRKKNDMFSLAILLLRNTGMRISELRDLEVNCLQKLPDGQYLLRVPLGKLKTERIIPVDSETAEVVRRILNQRELLLPLPNPRTHKPTQFLLVRKNWRRPSYQGLRDALNRAVIESGIQTRVSPHQLRHTYATELVRGGISLPVLMKLLGHRSISMTTRYTGVNPTDLQQAYHEALQKSRSLDLMPKIPKTASQEGSQTNGPDYIFDGIERLITKIGCIGRDFKDKKSQKKLQRISERLRRISQDINNVIQKQ